MFGFIQKMSRRSGGGRAHFGGSHHCYGRDMGFCGELRESVNGYAGQGGRPPRHGGGSGRRRRCGEDISASQGGAGFGPEDGGVCGLCEKRCPLSSPGCGRGAAAGNGGLLNE